MAKILKHGKNYIEEAKKSYKDVLVQCPECDNTICTNYYYLKVATDAPCECECGCSFIPESTDVVAKSSQREGRWIKRIAAPTQIEDEIEVYYECSCCGIFDFEQSHYCPACGAKMKEHDA